MAKLKLTISVDADLVKWVDQQVKEKKFASRSHGFEYAIAQAKKSHN